MVTQEFRSKTEHKAKCRKCKTTFLSVNGSPCPTCSEANKRLAEKREANKKQKADDNNTAGENTLPGFDAGEEVKDIPEE